jgi:hypothetical protein
VRHSKKEMTKKRPASLLLVWRKVMRKGVETSASMILTTGSDVKLWQAVL